MNCPKCKKQIDDDSKFCEFCGEKIINAVKKSVEIPIKKPCKDFENLKSKPWYRLIKVLYIVGFCISIFLFLASIDIDPTEKYIDNNKTIVRCKDGTIRHPSENNLNNYISLDSAGSLSSYQKNLLVKEFGNLCKNNEFDSKGVEIFYRTKLMEFIAYLIIGILAIIIIFEFLRQLGYYIFLGKFYPHRLYARLFKK